MPRHCKVSDEDLIKLHAAGVSQPAIAAHYGLRHVEPVRVRERKLGLAPRKPGGGPKLSPTVEDVLHVEN